MGKGSRLRPRIHRNYFDIIIPYARPDKIPADPAKTVDSYFYAHDIPPFQVSDDTTFRSLFLRFLLNQISQT
jgi:hypothetical protein